MNKLLNVVFGLVGLAAALLAPTVASAAVLRPELEPIGFLAGRWTNGDGAVGETGGRSTGSAAISVETGGAVLLSRAHTELIDAAGKSAGGFDQLLLIYPEDGTLHADYADGSHIIHYTSTQVTPGRLVTFLSAASPRAPAFRLTYELASANTLKITFGLMQPDGAFRPIAVGTLRRAD